MSGKGGADLKTTGMNLIAKGINEALGELKDITVDSYAGQGRGFDNLALSGLDLGNAGLQEKLQEFCDRWQWGVRDLVREGNAFAQAVGLAAGTLYEQDQYVQGSFKIVMNAAIGNPNATEEEVVKQGYGDIATSGMDADFSMEGMQGHLDKAGQGWQQVGNDPNLRSGLSKLEDL